MSGPSGRTSLVHATCIAWDSRSVADDVGRAGSKLAGVLLFGPSGSGKSDLALRMIDRGWRLVADDQCRLSSAIDRLLAGPPPTIAGKMELRGLGIVDLPHDEEAEVVLCVDLVARTAIERLPEPTCRELLGITVPELRLHAFDPSAPAKLHLAVSTGKAPILPAESPAGIGAPGDFGEMSERSKQGATDPAENGRAKRRVVLVTGLSGAGHSTALNTLEDLGYESIDNLPLELVELSLAGAGERPIALGIDIRSRNFAVEPFLERMDRLEADPGNDVILLFLHCDDETLRRRYTETRRRHPLAQDRALIHGIAAERRLLAPLHDRAGLVVDTSGLSLGDFRQTLQSHLALDTAPDMAIFILSFSYRQGLPRTADLVFDVRFLDNPHYVDDLRPLTGRDPEVQAYIRADPDFEPYFARLKDMLVPLLPRYEREGKSYLTIAFGCTGGRHRSVMLAETLAAEIRGQERQVTLVHRDIDKGDPGRASDGDSA